MAAQTPSWPVTVTGIALSEGTLLPNAGRFGLSLKPASAIRRRLPRRQAPWIVFAATGGFLAGMIAMALLMVAFRGLPAPAPQRSSAVSSPVTSVAECRAGEPTRPQPAEAIALVRQAEEDLRTRRLEVPIAGVDRRALPDTFAEQRDGPGPHAALDLPAPRNTPVVAVEDGTIARLYEGTEGGIAVYQFDPSGAYAYYYAHLDRYADGLEKGQPVKRGQVHRLRRHDRQRSGRHTATALRDPGARRRQALVERHARRSARRPPVSLPVVPVSGAIGRRRAGSPVRNRTAAVPRRDAIVPVTAVNRRNPWGIGAERALHLRRTGTVDRMITSGTVGRVVTSLRSTSLLSSAAVLCAALGVSATTAAAALFSTVAVRSVPFPEGHRLVRVWLANTAHWRHAGVAVDSGAARSRRSRRRLRRLSRHRAQPRRRVCCRPGPSACAARASPPTISRPWACAAARPAADRGGFRRRCAARRP